MIAALVQQRDNGLDRAERGADVGRAIHFASIVQADDGSIGGAIEHPAGNTGRGPAPVAADDRPHDAEQAQTLLRIAEPEPPDSVRRAEQARQYARVRMNCFLRRRQFPVNEFPGTEIEARMTIAVISDFVPGEFIYRELATAQ